MLGNLPLPRDKIQQDHASGKTRPDLHRQWPNKPKGEAKRQTQWDKDSSNPHIFVVEDQHVHPTKAEVESGDIRVLRDLKEYVTDKRIADSWVPHRRLDEGAWHRVQTRTTSKFLNSVPNFDRSRIGENR